MLKPGCGCLAAATSDPISCKFRSVFGDGNVARKFKCPAALLGFEARVQPRSSLPARSAVSGGRSADIVRANASGVTTTVDKLKLHGANGTQSN
jgi:hypothetical protein